MNTTVNGYWNVKKEKLKQKYPDIKEKDLRYNEGKGKSNAGDNWLQAW